MIFAGQNKGINKIVKSLWRCSCLLDYSEGRISWSFPYGVSLDACIGETRTGYLPTGMQVPHDHLGAYMPEGVDLLSATTTKKGRTFAGPRIVHSRNLRNYSCWSCRPGLCGLALLTVLVSVVAVALLISLCAQEQKKALGKGLGSRRLSETKGQEPSTSSMCVRLTPTGSDGASYVSGQSHFAGVPLIELKLTREIAHTQQKESNEGESRKAPVYRLPAGSPQSAAYELGEPKLLPSTVEHAESSIRRTPAEAAAAAALLQLSSASVFGSDSSAEPMGIQAFSDQGSTLSEGPFEGGYAQEQVHESVMLAHPVQSDASSLSLSVREALFEQAFYHIPFLQSHMGLRTLDAGRAFSVVHSAQRIFPSVWHAQGLLSPQTISAGELHTLIGLTERIISHCVRHERRPVAWAMSRAVAKLGLRFLMVDIVFCTLQLLGENVLTGPWVEFINAMPHEVPLKGCPSFCAGQRRFNATLARALSEAMAIFKSGVRPAKDHIIWLKRMLFCSPLAPRTFRIYLQKTAKEVLERLC